MDDQRIILHIDMDAFYASIEQRDNPELRDKPVAVGGSSQRGVVAAASYEARKYGVHSALSSVLAKKRCPALIFVKPRFDVYRSVSEEIREIFLHYTPLVEPLSLDEAYLDITDVVASLPAGEELARGIRRDIFKATKLHASAGVSYNKFLAKTASDVNKPDGQFTITFAEAQSFLNDLPVQKFHGIGSATAERMKKLGIEYGIDMLNWPEHRLVQLFGKAGRHYYNIVRGVDEREVNPHRIRKSVGVERTFGENLKHPTEVDNAFENIIALLLERISRHGKSGRTLTLKLRYADFTTITRSKTGTGFLDRTLIKNFAWSLLHESWKKGEPLRLMGLTVSNLQNEALQYQLKLNI